MRLRRLVLCIGLGVAASTTAFAAPPKAAASDPTPAGRWRFQTDRVNGGNCTLAGDMNVWKAASSYKCRFTAVQACGGVPPIRIEVEQSCNASLDGMRVTIQSKIEKYVKVSPPEMEETVRSGYAPDHFKVTLNAAGSEMSGMFHSLSDAPVVFRRVVDLTS